MNFAKCLAILLLISTYSFSQDTSFSAKIEVRNNSAAVDDVSAKVIVNGGVEPYKYVWNNSKISIYYNEVEGLSEGETLEVMVIDANLDTAFASTYVAPESTQEHISFAVKPAVNFLQTVLFTNIWSDTVRVNEFFLRAPSAVDASKTDYKLKEWLKPNGEKVKHLEPIAILKDGDEEITLFAIGEGVLQYGMHNEKLVQAGDDVFYINKRNNRTDKVLGKIVYEEAQPFYYKNLSFKTEGIPLIVLWLIFGAIFFTFKLRFIQFNPRRIKHSIDLVRGKYHDPNQKKGEVSHFQALMTALSATVGLGNIAGVAIAISLGGPGATVWMIVAGFFGMALKFVEATLGVKYRIQNEDGEVSGGPMYYLSRGLALRGPGMKKLGKVLAVVFAVLCVGGSLGGGNMFQVNSAFNQLAGLPALQGIGAFGFYFGLGMAVLVGIVIVGGIRSIANVTDKIVPFMVGLYVLSALFIIGINYENIGTGFYLIFKGAFSPEAIYGGFIGVLVVGFQRAAFSNEAGVGSSPIAHSAAKTDKPISEGAVALLEPFLDTVVVCTMTSLIIIFSGYAQDAEGLEGAALTSAAFASSIGDWFLYVLALAVLLFAFSTMISWSYYGLKAWTYLFGASRWANLSYKLLFLTFVVIGSSIGLGSVLDFSDLMILGMAFPNILGLIIMSGEVRKDMKKYFNDLKTGVIKKFK